MIPGLLESSGIPSTLSRSPAPSNRVEDALRLIAEQQTAEAEAAGEEGLR